MSYKIGDRLRWTSSNAPKTGEVVAIVPAGKRPKDVGHPNAGGGGFARDHESYILRGAPDYAPKRRSTYWPVVSLLKPVEA
jgi:hypothetical protein